MEDKPSSVQRGASGGRAQEETLKLVYRSLPDPGKREVPTARPNEQHSSNDVDGFEMVERRGAESRRKN